ncbi:MAG: branched-chain amino acid ABC transporter permease [Thermotogae bacterium]|nr:branched-chain amino acid ABC transporter permease [Thermotogota bacterium]
MKADGEFFIGFHSFFIKDKEMMKILQAIVNGILLGGIYSLIATGLSLIWGVMRIINWAHGAMVMLAMYLTFFAYSILGLDPILSLPLVAAIMFIVGYILQIVLVERTLNSPWISRLCATFGLMMLLESLALVLWSSNWRTVSVPYRNWAFHIGNVSIPFTHFLAFSLALLMALALYFFLNRTEAGKAIKATAQDREAASLMGININKIYRVTFGIGLALTGVAGSSLMTFYYVFPKVGFPFALTAYMICVLGGLGRLNGAILGGLIIGVAQTVSAYLISPEYKMVVSFLIFLGVLYFKPGGMFGGVTE